MTGQAVQAEIWARRRPGPAIADALASCRCRRQLRRHPPAFRAKSRQGMEKILLVPSCGNDHAFPLWGNTSEHLGVGTSKRGS